MSTDPKHCQIMPEDVTLREFLNCQDTKYMQGSHV